jgi:hypothetical protein
VIAALFVATGGCYFGLEGVDPWDQARDARLYPGPHPVVAHPPCERWGRYWSGGPSAKVRRELGDDGGCFASALESVRRWGGVLEHPEASYAWPAHGLTKPPRKGGWIPAGDGIGWTCCVEQGAYGHRARKATWLYVVHPTGFDRVRFDLTWRSPHEHSRLDAGFHSAEERRLAPCKEPPRRLTARENLATPPAFRDVLIAMARSVNEQRNARAS